jgi:hypothetical protein
MEPTHGEILKEVRALGERIAVLEVAAHEQEGALRFAKWMIAFLVALGGLGLGAYKIFSGDAS